MVTAGKFHLASLALEIATLMRFGLKRNLTPRGISSAHEVIGTNNRALQDSEIYHFSITLSLITDLPN